MIIPKDAFDIPTVSVQAAKDCAWLVYFCLFIRGLSRLLRRNK